MWVSVTKHGKIQRKEIKGSFSDYSLIFLSLRQMSNVYAITLTSPWEQGFKVSQ